MARQQIQLASGVDLLTEQTERFKTGLFTVTLTVPLRRETATANAMIPEVLYRGTKSRPDIVSLSAATDDLYGAALEVGVRQCGESQCICLRCCFIDDSYALDGIALLEPAVDLVAEILQDPLTENGVFSRNYVSSEGINLADRIQSRINDKAEWALFRLISEMCAEENYAVDKLGNDEEAINMDACDLWAQYNDLLAKANIIFYYSGAASPDRVELAVRHAFCGLITDRIVRPECVVVQKPSGALRELTEEMDVTQGKLAIGFRTGGITADHQSYPALLVCNALYGETGTSRLFMHVREKLGLCYFASSMIDKIKGIMAVLSGVEFTDFHTAETEILAQLDEIRRGEFTDQELNAAIRYVVSGLISRGDNQGQMEDDAVSGMIGFGKWPEYSDLIRAVECVTAEQVAEVAGQLHPDMIYRITGKGAV